MVQFVSETECFSLDVSSNDKNLISGHADGILRIWQLSLAKSVKGKPPTVINAPLKVISGMHQGAVTSISFS